jgi:type I restriction enzyme, S subunit
MNWQEKELQDVCSLITDGAHNSPKSVESGLPMASVKDLTSFGINLETSRLISEDDFHRLIKMNCQPRKGDILIAKDGASALDTICEIKQNIDVVLLSSVAILRPNPEKIVSPYLRYYLESPITRRYMKSGFITGAAIPRVVLEDFKRVKIRIPPLPTQRKIAVILSAYDDLIENNTRRIQILEEMAQNLYRHWFVDFKFPGHEDVSLVDSGTALGLVPEGWKIVSLLKIADVTYGYGFKSHLFTTEETDIPIIRIRDIPKISTETYSTETTNAKYIVEDGDILVGMDGDFHMCIWAGGIAYLNQRVARFRSINGIVCEGLLFMLLKEPIMFFNKTITGTTVAHLGDRHIRTIQVLLPNSKLLIHANSLFRTLSSLELILRKKNSILRQTRDLLLPKLVSGELDVSELPIDVGF